MPIQVKVILNEIHFLRQPHDGNTGDRLHLSLEDALQVASDDFAKEFRNCINELVRSGEKNRRDEIDSLEARLKVLKDIEFRQVRSK